MKKVNLFIVGQPKSGTTALANYLNQHPNVCMAYPKEPGYFAYDHIQESDAIYGAGTYLKARTLQEYKQHFKHYEGEQIVGEATTTYLYSTVAAQAIHDYNPEAKIIVMLRHPVPFLHSLHMQYVNDGSEDERDFATALAKEEARRRGKDVPHRAIVPSLLYYSDRIKYAEQVQRYKDLFPDAQILVLGAEDFREDNTGVFKQVLDFLEVDDTFEPTLDIVNPSAKPRSYAVHRALNSLALKKSLYNLLGPRHYTSLKAVAISVVMKRRERTDMNETLRQQLLDMSRSEVAKISHVTHIDFMRKWRYETSPETTKAG